MKIWTTQYKDMVKAEAKKGHYVNGELAHRYFPLEMKIRIMFVITRPGILVHQKWYD